MRISDWSADVCSSDLFGIGPCYNGFVAIAPILSEGDFPEQEIAQLIDAERCRQFKRIRDLADRFRHFFSSVEEKAVAEHLAGQRYPRPHPKGGPVTGLEAQTAQAPRAEKVGH